jgi:L,D-transpeptidase ErfK/SrfK
MYGLSVSKHQEFSANIRGRITRSFLVLLCVIMLFAILFLFGKFRQMPEATIIAAVDPAIAAMDEPTLRKQISLTEEKLRQLDDKSAQLFPSGLVILVDSAANQISLLRNSKIDIQDKCSTGTGFELSDESGKRTWTFDTPRGYFKVTGKVTNPVWIRPDWAFIEEGSPIPKNREERAVANVLGDYAIAFGNGFFIHGTLYTRLLGTSVTHGCIRLGDDTLKKIYQAVQVGTPIWIY